LCSIDDGELWAKRKQQLRTAINVDGSGRDTGRRGIGVNSKPNNKAVAAAAKGIAAAAQSNDPPAYACIVMRVTTTKIMFLCHQ
jgi:hypothetical protein